MSNLVINVQHDVGKWCTEYSWSAEDEMWGIKFLHNFGRLGSLSDIVDEGGTRRGLKRVDEEEPVEGGLKGRVSIGGELYFSAKEKSAGGECSVNITNVLCTKKQKFTTVSTGIRFTTLPDAPSQTSGSPSASQSHRSPPTTITALFNPMLGHISAAYTAKVCRDLALSSRFEFNVYSFESEWTMGAEWWLRRPSRVPTDDDIGPSQNESLPLLGVNGVVKARASTNNVKTFSLKTSCPDNLYASGCISYVGGQIKEHDRQPRRRFRPL
jgi:distribution and morphology protein 10